MPTLLRSFVVLTLGICGWAITGLADNWPQWRGAKHDGISHEDNIATTWSKTDGVAWSMW